MYWGNHVLGTGVTKMKEIVKVLTNRSEYGRLDIHNQKCNVMEMELSGTDGAERRTE